MKKLLILPGNSPKNIEWGESCAEYFQSQFDSVYCIKYKHWSSGEAEIDFASELKSIEEVVVGSDASSEWFMFAKSIGSVLALKAIQQNIISPEKCVFFGMPLKIASNMPGHDWTFLMDCQVPFLAFHNEFDPIAEYEFTIEKLRTFTPKTKIVTLGDNTHYYLDFAAYAKEIDKFITL